MREAGGADGGGVEIAGALEWRWKAALTAFLRLQRLGGRLPARSLTKDFCGEPGNQETVSLTGRAFTLLQVKEVCISKQDG